MPHAPTPWIGLAALAAMFLLPLLPNWLFDGPRTVKHRPRRHVCADCHAPWTDDHTCSSAVEAAYPPLQGQLRRFATTTDLQRRQENGRPRHKPDRAILGRSQRPPAATTGD
jgi:hypothetical protein